MKNIFTSILVTVMLVVSTYAVSGEDALYEAEAPENSAFIRIVNLNPSIAINEATVGGKVLSTIKPISTTSYIFLPEGEYTLEIDNRAEKLNLARGEFYTVVSEKDEIKVIHDEKFANRRKSLITFYNFLTEQEASLVTADGKVKVIENVNYESKASREINPVKVELVTMVDDKRYGAAETVSLKRGQVTSLFAIGTLEKPVLLKVDNKIDTSI